MSNSNVNDKHLALNILNLKFHIHCYYPNNFVMEIESNIFLNDANNLLHFTNLNT